MSWQFVFFSIMFAAFVWHIVNDRATPEPDSCPLCEARIMHTHKGR